jgi:hypothetical protein
MRGTYGGTYGDENSGPHMDVLLDPKTLMSIWDMSASFGLTPFRSDFIDYVACAIPVWDGTKVNTVIGIRTTLHKFTDTIRDFQSIFLVYLIVYLRRMSIYSPPKLTIKYMVGSQRFIATA